MARKAVTNKIALISIIVVEVLILAGVLYWKFKWERREVCYLVRFIVRYFRFLWRHVSRTLCVKEEYWVDHKLIIFIELLLCEITDWMPLDVDCWSYVHLARRSFITLAALILLKLWRILRSSVDFVVWNVFLCWQLNFNWYDFVMYFVNNLVMTW